MKFAVVSFFRKVIAFLSSLFLFAIPAPEQIEKPETTSPANSVSDYDASAADYSLCVDGTKTLHGISDLLFGAFFEDINFAGDGGLYAEMVSNRSFEFTSLAAGDGLFGYSSVNNAAISLTKDAAKGLNANNPTFVTVKNDGDAPAGIANRGWMEGMAVKDGEPYRLATPRPVLPTGAGWREWR